MKPREKHLQSGFVKNIAFGEGNPSSLRAELSLNDHRLYRYLVGVVGGTAIALGLTWFMAALIESGESELDESGRVHIVDFVRVDRQETVQRKARKVERMTTATPPSAPPTPQADSSAADAASSLAVSVLPTGLESMSMTGGIGVGQQDAEYLPIVKVAAVYPISALRKKTEGYCTVVYTVTTTGTTKNVRLVPGACTDPIFESPSIEAALKFKYRPRVLNGEAIEVKGIQNKFIFEMEKP